MADLYKREGKTNLGDYYLKRVREKEEALNKKQFSGLMIPPSLLGPAGSFDSFRGQNAGFGFGGQSSALPNLLGGNQSQDQMLRQLMTLTGSQSAPIPAQPSLFSFPST